MLDNIEINNESETSEIAKLEHYRQTGKTDKRKNQETGKQGKTLLNEYGMRLS